MALAGTGAVGDSAPDLDANVVLLEKICNLESTLTDKVIATNEEKLSSNNDSTEDQLVATMQARMLRMEKNYRVLAERYIAMRQHCIRVQQQMAQLRLKVLELSAINAALLAPPSGTSQLSGGASSQAAGDRERTASVATFGWQDVISSTSAATSESAAAHRDLRSPSVATAAQARSAKDAAGSMGTKTGREKADELRSPRSASGTQRAKEKKEKREKEKEKEKERESMGTKGTQSGSGKRTITVGSMMDALHIFSESGGSNSGSSSGVPARPASPASVSPRRDGTAPGLLPDGRAAREQRRVQRRSGEASSAAAEALAFSAAAAASPPVHLHSPVSSSGSGSGGGGALMTWFQALSTLQDTNPHTLMANSPVSHGSPSTASPSAGSALATVAPSSTVTSAPIAVPPPLSLAAVPAGGTPSSPASASPTSQPGSAPPADPERWGHLLSKKAPPPSPPAHMRAGTAPPLPSPSLSGPIPSSASATAVTPRDPIPDRGYNSSGGVPAARDVIVQPAVPSTSSRNSEAAYSSNSSSPTSRSASASPGRVPTPSFGPTAADVVKRGFLFKIGAKVVRKYTFELVLPDAPGASAALAWKFNDRGARLGAVLLRGARLITEQQSGASENERLRVKPNSFALQPSLGPKLKRFFFAAPSKEELDSWIALLTPYL